jgi:hypothetical protein
MHEAHRFAPVGLDRDQYRPALVRVVDVDHQGRWRSGQKPAGSGNSRRVSGPD